MNEEPKGSGRVLNDGEWVNGRKEGKGTLYFANGDSFQGNWTEGVLSGPGFLTLNADSPWNMADL